MKPHYKIPIEDCGEPLVAIPLNQFAVVTPHPYQALGAPYGDRSPYFLRKRVLEALRQAQLLLQEQHPSWSIQIFDAYRPVPVQAFMVQHTFQTLLEEQGLKAANLNEAKRQALLEEVYRFWASPSLDLATPPPHSTGAAVDVTLLDSLGQVVDMGSPIDEVSPRSHPNHYWDNPDSIAQTWHQHRQLLNSVMHQAGFRRHPNEWWHFSFGDQLWAWMKHQETGEAISAFYGRWFEAEAMGDEEWGEGVRG